MNRIINWMGGWPKEGLIGAGEWEERTGKFAATGRQETFGTEPVQGQFGLREQVAERIAGSAAESDPSRVWIAAGADAAIELAVRGWLRAEDVVLVERPCGRSALQIFQRAGAVAVAVPGDRDGMDPDALARAIRQWKPKLVYAAVACTDPEGRAWSAERRIGLAERCREANVPLLRDDRQLLLAQDGLAPDVEAEAGAPLCSVGEWPPGIVADLRLGWLACRGIGEERLQALSAGSGRLPQVPPAEQQAAAELLQAGTLESLVATQRFVCRARVGLLLEQLSRHNPRALAWETPKEGMHVWVTLPEGLDADSLLRAAWIHGLLFQPGRAFYASEPERFKLRITAVHSDEKQIRAGVQRLQATVEEMMGRYG